MSEEFHCSNSQLLEMCNVYSCSLETIAMSTYGTNVAHYSDTVYGHHWAFASTDTICLNQTCVCGLVDHQDVITAQADYRLLGYSGNASSDRTLWEEAQHPMQRLKDITENVNVDMLKTKVNAFRLATDTASLVLSVGNIHC